MLSDVESGGRSKEGARYAYLTYLKYLKYLSLGARTLYEYPMLTLYLIDGPLQEQACKSSGRNLMRASLPIKLSSRLSVNTRICNSKKKQGNFHCSSNISILTGLDWTPLQTATILLPLIIPFQSLE